MISMFTSKLMKIKLFFNASKIISSRLSTNNLVWTLQSSFLIKLQTGDLQLYFKRDSDTVFSYTFCKKVFLWNLFRGCFWISRIYWNIFDAYTKKTYILDQYCLKVFLGKAFLKLFLKLFENHSRISNTI